MLIQIKVDCAIIHRDDLYALCWCELYPCNLIGAFECIVIFIIAICVEKRKPHRYPTCHCSGIAGTGF